MILRCTGRVLDLLGGNAVTLAEPPPTDDDWYVNLLWFDRQKCFLFTHAQAAEQRARSGGRIRRGGFKLGRPRQLPSELAERIRLERGAGRSFSPIAEALNAEGVPTAQGGRRRWPATVRTIVLQDAA